MQHATVWIYNKARSALWCGVKFTSAQLLLIRSVERGERGIEGERCCSGRNRKASPLAGPRVSHVVRLYVAQININKTSLLRTRDIRQVRPGTYFYIGAGNWFKTFRGRFCHFQFVTGSESFASLSVSPSLAAGHLDFTSPPPPSAAPTTGVVGEATVGLSTMFQEGSV